MSKTMSKMEKIKSIRNEKGIQYILDAAYAILGNPILLHDMDYHLIAHNEDTTDDPIWNEFMENGRVGYDRLVFYRDEGFFDMAADARKVSFLPSDKLKYERLFGKLFTKNNIQIGAACLTAADRSFEADTPELFEAVVDILNKEFSRSKFYQDYGQSYMENLIARLIEGSLEDIDLYTAHIESLYIGLKNTLCLAVMDSPTSSREELEGIRKFLRRARPDYKYAIYSNGVVVIMSFQDDFSEKKAFFKLGGLIAHHRLRVGLSGRFENMLELPRRYREAVASLL